MTSLFDWAGGGAISAAGYLFGLLAAFACGVLSAFAASYRSRATRSLVVSLILLPMIVMTVITMVNGNIGTGVAVAGAFSLVRFRSAAGKAKDIALIFMAMTAGLACAAGYAGLALIFTAVLSGVVAALAHIPLGDERSMELHITVPESLRFAHEFDDVFEQYAVRCRLLRTKTTDMGSMYNLLYLLELRDPSQAQEMIDALRCRNGNLEIALMEASEGGEAL